VQKTFWINGLAVDPHLIMKVRSGRAAGRAEPADDRALINFVALADQRFDR